MNDMSVDRINQERIPILLSEEDLLNGFTKHKDIAYIFSFGSIGSVCILISDLINNHTFTDPFFMLLAIISTSLAYIFLNVAFMRQMKIYNDGLSMPTRPMICILLGRDYFIPLNNITKCSILLNTPIGPNSEKRVLFQIQIRHRFKRTTTDHEIGKHFILDFIKYIKINKDWNEIVRIEPDAQEFLQLDEN